MKAHIGTDRHGIVHSPSTTAANVSDITQMPELLDGEEREVLGDQACWSEAHRQAALAKGIRYRVSRRSRQLADYLRYVFHVAKRLWGFRKFATAGWLRIRHASSRPFRWRICIR